MRKIILIISAILLIANLGVFAESIPQKNATVNVNAAKKTDTQTTAATAEKKLSAIELKKNEAEQKKAEAKQTEEAKNTTKKTEKEAQQATFEERIKELIKEEVALVSTNEDALQSKLYIAYSIAALALILALYLLFLFLQGKKNFRKNLIQELNNCEEGGTMDKWQKSLLSKVSQPSKFDSSCLPQKIDEQQFKQLFEACYASKQCEQEKNKEQKAEQQKVLQQSQPQSLYADSIIEGKFNRVKEEPDENETNFELKLARGTDTTAKVVIYKGAYRRIIANPAFLEGCEKQLVGNNYTTVTTTKEGVATKDSDGKWRITTITEVKIS